MPDWLNSILDAPGSYIRGQAAQGAQDVVSGYIPVLVIGGCVLVAAVWLASR